jgi:hypothetical protein
MILSIILILLIIFGVGLPITLWLVPNHNVWGRLGLSYLLGIGLFTLIMFVANILGLRFSLQNIFVLLLPLLLVLVLLQRRKVRNLWLDLVSIVKNPHLDFSEKIMVGVMAFLVVSSFIYTFYWPVYMWDSLVLYDFRAHIFSTSGFMKEAFVNAYYTGYPLLTSLAHTIVYLARGGYPQIFDSLFYFSLGLCFYGLLREFLSRKLSLLFTLILFLSSPLYYHSTTSYTNLAYTAYISLGALYLYLWDKKKRVGYLILSALLVGLSTWTRSVEPFWLAVLFIVFVVSVYRKKIWNILIYSLFFFPIHEAWKVFQASLRGTDASTTGEIAQNISLLSNILNFGRWREVFIYLYRDVVLPWGAISTAFALSIFSLFLLKKVKEQFLIFFITFIFLVVMLLGTFAFSFTASNWSLTGIDDAAQRLSMLFYPLLVCCIAKVSSEISLNKRK